MSDLDGPLSDQLLDRLRLSAAMVAAVPELAVQVRMGDVPCLEVRRTPVPGATHRVLPPCAFHRAVAGAVGLRRSGERIAMRGVPASTEPTIDWGLAAGARLLPGGIVRIDRDGEWVFLAAALAEDRHVEAGLGPCRGVASHRDEALGVTIVAGAVTSGDRAGARALVDELVGALARIGVSDLEERLGGAAVGESRSHP